MKSKRKRFIKLHDEIVTKDDAKKLLHLQDQSAKEDDKNNENNGKSFQKKRKRKNRKNLGNKEVESEEVVENFDKSPKRKRKRKSQIQEYGTESSITDEKNPEEQTEVLEDVLQEEESSQRVNDVSEKPASIRHLKREKHKALLEEKKLSSEAKIRDRALNYLSKWKYNNKEWKFEKLLQVWLLKHLFDSEKVPEKHWQTTLEYFIKAKGKVKSILMEKAAKVINEERQDGNIGDEDNCDLRLKRAKSVAQFLDE